MYIYRYMSCIQGSTENQSKFTEWHGFPQSLFVLALVFVYVCKYRLAIHTQSRNHTTTSELYNYNTVITYLL